tara:strand:+ start:1324 stop:2274 length:951 start_codon:yes stop_codon:yes gene_type:complete
MDIVVTPMRIEDKIYVAGHNGLLGSAVVRRLGEEGYRNLILKTSSEVDLRDSSQVKDFFEKERPDYVFLCAASCGGVQSNIHNPVGYIQDNLDIQSNVIKNAHNYKVKKLLFVGSAAIYPQECDQPIREESLFSNYLSPANEFYCIAKIAGIKLCQAYKKECGDNFISVQPNNIYGPRDKFSESKGHVMAALITKFHKAKKTRSSEVICWGSGNARREFIYVEDLADALLFVMNNYNDNEPINIGVGEDHSIKEVAQMISDVVEYDGKIEWDITKPEGVSKRLLDSSKLFSMGWTPTYGLLEGLTSTYDYYKLEVK